MKLNPRIAAGRTCLSSLALLAVSLGTWGCSKPSAPEPAKTAAETPAPAPQAAEAVDEELPLTLRTPWKGDLDAIVKRRTVRVLTLRHSATSGMVKNLIPSRRKRLAEVISPH